MTGLLLIVFNGGYAAPWETFTIFALMFTGHADRAEAGQFPWRRALYVTVLVFGLTLVAAQWHDSPLGGDLRRDLQVVQLGGVRRADLRGGHAVPP